MKCAFSQATSPSTQDQRPVVTQARYLYVSTKATFPLSPPAPERSVNKATQEGAHEMCLLPSNVPLDPRPRTQSDTSATSLRKQKSKLPFKRPTPEAGQCTGMYTAASEPETAHLVR
ncbi:hypothetical protein [Desulfosporosinus nitroreducens]|uniref:Uncharacterized protein n=1 Tax=Desulfosporosinus nitroreducens TaxID=2018668 RepID=A0ABT8QT34_9FIRM|nr:hypothetical protein [Desulfosporosinus nitroreducens]MDO0824465.1 hypothetical protein [Desulfosporosinus nitroreducens]